MGARGCLPAQCFSTEFSALSPLDRERDNLLLVAAVVLPILADAVDDVTFRELLVPQRLATEGIGWAWWQCLREFASDALVFNSESRARRAKSRRTFCMLYNPQ